MFFEDEKENNQSIDTLNGYGSDSGDDKSITWDDLLNDDSSLDLSSVKKTDSGQYEDFEDLDISDGDFDLEGSDTFDDSSATGDFADTDFSDAEPSKDAFDVFGGDSTDADDDIDLNLLASDDVTTSPTVAYDDEEDISYGIETDNKPAQRRQRAKSAAAVKKRKPAPKNVAPAPKKESEEDEDDVYYFEPNKAKKGFNPLPVVVGIILACLLAVGGVYVFMSNSNTVSKSDFDSLRNQAAPDIALDKNAPGVTDVSAENADNAVTNEADKLNAEKAKKAEADARKMVILPVSNAGRLNPFVPAKGFDTVVAAESSSYEVLTPPDELGDEDTGKEASRLMQITVSGILYDNVKPSAIINVSGSDYFVQTGDKVDEFQVIDINPNFVVIKYGRNMYRAQVGENFANKVEGMATRQSGRYPGSRNYTSVSEVQVNVKDENNNNNNY